MSKPLPIVSSWAVPYVDDDQHDEIIDVTPTQAMPPVAVSLSLIAQFAAGAVVAMVAATLPPIFAIPLFAFAFWLIARTWRRYRATK